MQATPIIVTGAAGFVGRALVASLLERGDRVVAVDSDCALLPPHPGLRCVAGDIGSVQVRSAAFDDGCSALVHLATVPGGAAEADPAASRRINVDATYDLLEAARSVAPTPRVLFASSIAVFGDALPAGGVDDSTPVAPRLVYGGHKAMMETAVALMSRRGEIDGVTVRLSAILARSKGPSGMKSAFMSDLFHALRAHEPLVCPVSPGATIWAQSRSRCVANLVHAIDLDGNAMPASRTVTLPAIRTRIDALVGEVARQCGAPEALVRYQPDPALEAGFGAYPPLATAAADAAGFAHDGDLSGLVRNALSAMHD